MLGTKPLGWLDFTVGVGGAGEAAACFSRTSHREDRNEASETLLRNLELAVCDETASKESGQSLMAFLGRSNWERRDRNMAASGANMHDGGTKGGLFGGRFRM